MTNLWHMLTKFWNRLVVRLWLWPLWFNPFVPNAPFLYPLKISENRKVLRCFQGVEKRCIGKKWLNAPIWWKILANLFPAGTTAGHFDIVPIFSGFLLSIWQQFRKNDGVTLMLSCETYNYRHERHWIVTFTNQPAHCYTEAYSMMEPFAKIVND